MSALSIAYMIRAANVNDKELVEPLIRLAGRKKALSTETSQKRNDSTLMRAISPRWNTRQAAAMMAKLKAKVSFSMRV